MVSVLKSSVFTLLLYSSAEYEIKRSNALQIGYANFYYFVEYAIGH